jgi:hypothetical protein
VHRLAAAAAAAKRPAEGELLQVAVNTEEFLKLRVIIIIIIIIVIEMWSRNKLRIF